MKRARMLGAIALALLLTVLSLPAQTRATERCPIVRLAPSTVVLYGPWKFRIGDDARWASPDFDDSSWQTVSLRAPADATDGDVGITRYAPGWNAWGYRGYFGYAWYRIHLDVRAKSVRALALLGPGAVDSAYQLFVNGKLR